MPFNPVLDYEPRFDISESLSMELGNTKINQRLQLIVDFEVIEKTKSFTVL